MMSGQEETRPRKKRQLAKQKVAIPADDDAITAANSNAVDDGTPPFSAITSNRWASLADRLNPNRAAYDPEFSARYKSMSKAQRRLIQKEDQAKIRELKKRGKTLLPFDADDDDHCETSSVAYEHIVPILSYLACRLQKATPSELKIYDPYFCAGGTVQHMNSLGFPNVHNQPEDFYLVVKENKVPIHDVVITNPPYSADHFDRLIEFLKVNNKPFLLLLPDHFTKNPTYQKHYEKWLYKDLFYVTPPQRYHYWIPEGRRCWQQQKEEEEEEEIAVDMTSTKEKQKRKKKSNNKQHHSNLHLGTRNSPFSSLWFISLAPAVKKRKKILKAYKRGNKNNQNNNNSNNSPGQRDGASSSISFVGGVTRKQFRLPPGCLLHDDFASAKKAEQSFRGGGSSMMKKQQQESSSSLGVIVRGEEPSSASAVDATISTKSSYNNSKRKRKRDNKQTKNMKDKKKK